jgi:23S rRNA pseudouridine1911/1915/1917 synthase
VTAVRLVVRPGEPRTVGEVLALHGIVATAVADGRVFLGAKRVDDAAASVKDGDELAVETARDIVLGVEILSEFRDLYAVSKPPGLPTEPDRSGTASVVDSVARLLKAPRDVIHAATRLDAQVSGIAVIARGAEAARFAAALKQSGRLRRRYLAVAARAVEPAEGVWDAPVGEPSRGGKGARDAVSRYAVVESARPLPSAPTPALFVVEPVTGRTHQIRLHASGAGAPLLGDVKHGGPRRVVLADGRMLTFARVALHAARIQADVEDEAPWTVTAALPDDMTELWASLGGDGKAVARALEHSFRKR